MSGAATLLILDEFAEWDVFVIGKKSNLGAYFRQKREAAGLTQEQVGTSLGYSSGHQYVSNWERGASPPPMDKLFEIARLYDISADELIGVILDEQKRLLCEMLKVDTKIQSGS